MSVLFANVDLKNLKYLMINMGKKTWNQNEILFLKNNYFEFGSKRISEILKKTRSSIMHKAKREHIAGCLNHRPIKGKSYDDFYGFEKSQQIKNLQSINIKEKLKTLNLKGRNLNETNGQWKGNNVGYKALHQWISGKKQKPERCIRCNQTPAYDLANISGQYKRDINDFEWICRKCHMVEDNRLKKLHSEENIQKIRKNPILCSKCKEIKKHKAKNLCNKCYSNMRYHLRVR